MTATKSTNLHFFFQNSVKSIYYHKCINVHLVMFMKAKTLTNINEVQPPCPFTGFI